MKAIFVEFFLKYVITTKLHSELQARLQHNYITCCQGRPRGPCAEQIDCSQLHVGRPAMLPCLHQAVN